MKVRRKRIAALLLALGVALGSMPTSCVLAADAAVGEDTVLDEGTALEAAAPGQDAVPEEDAVSEEVMGMEEDAASEEVMGMEEDAASEEAIVTEEEAASEEVVVLEESADDEAAEEAFSDLDNGTDAEDTVGRSDGTGPYSIDSWWAAAKEKASEADHVIGPDSEIGDIFGYDGLTYSKVHYYTVILPGETIAILPEVNLNNSGIQGGISYFTFTIWQLDEPAFEMKYLKDSQPESTALTPLESSTMPIPYGDRTVDRPDDPVNLLDDSITEVSYVSLYRNDTGLPIIMDGARGGYFDRRENYGKIHGKADAARTNYQGEGSRLYGPRLTFAEPYYDILIDRAAEYGTYYYQRRNVDFEKVKWPDPLSNYTLRIPVDMNEHTYEFPLPVLATRRFDKYESYNGGPFMPDEGQRNGNVVTYTVNLMSKSHNYNSPNLQEYLRDQGIWPVFDGGPTLFFDANGGTIDGQSMKYFEVRERNSTVVLSDYVPNEPVLENHIFLGWCTDPEKPEETIVTSLPSSGNQHIDVYAAWKEYIDISKASVTGNSLSYGYSGKAYTPAVTVKVNGKVLTEGTDYTIEYKNNINPGTATISIKGIGQYTGTRTKTFEIVDCVSSIVNGKTYLMIPKNNSKTAVCSFGGKMVNNTKVYITDRSSSEAMKFKAVKNADGTWKFINAKCELALAVQQNSSEAGKGLVLYQQTTRTAQNWKLSRKSDNSFAIINAVSGLSVAMSDASAVKGTTLSMAETASSGLQRFYIVETDPVSSPYSREYAVKAAKDKKFALNIASSSKTDGANVNLYTYSNTAAKRFRFLYSGGGYYRIMNVNSGLVLTVKGNTKTNGANIIQSAWAGESGQRWKVTKNSDGTVTLTNALGTVVHLNGNQTANGTNVVAKTKASTTAQKWYLQ